MPKSSSTANTKDNQALNRDIILAKAFQIADREGIENLSVRKLAGELGKTPMALYRHFDSIEKIKQDVVALALTEVDTAPIPGERWDDTLRRTTASLRQMTLNHYRAHFHLVESAAWSPSLKDHTDRIQKLHRNQNIPKDILKRMWRIVDAYLTGFNIKEIGNLERVTPHSEINEPEWMPITEKAYSEQAFQDGIEIIIAGIRKIAAPDPCEWYTSLDL